MTEEIKRHMKEHFPVSKPEMMLFLRSFPPEMIFQMLGVSTEVFSWDLPVKLSELLKEFNARYKENEEDEGDETYINSSQLAGAMLMNNIRVSQDHKHIEFVHRDSAFKAFLRDDVVEMFKLLSNATEGMALISDLWNSAAYTRLKPGKFFKAFFPNATPQHCEAFVAAHQQWLQRFENPDIRLLEGDDIVKYYNKERYVEGRGSLQKSCMAHSGKWRLTALYSDLKLKMVALFDPDDETKIRSRAILWEGVKAVIDGEQQTITLLDRIYYTTEEDINVMKAFAEKNQWCYKLEQNYNNKTGVMVPVNGSYEAHRLNMLFKSKGSKRDSWPYIDTFTYGNNDCSVLGNREEVVDENISNSRRVYSYTSTGGSRG